MRKPKSRDIRHDMLSSEADFYNYSGRKKPFLWKRIIQLLVSVVLLSAIWGLSVLDYPAADGVRTKISYYLTDERSNQLPAVVSAFQEGIWTDTFEKGIMETLGGLNVSENTTDVKTLTIPVSGSIIRPYGWEEQADGQKLLHPGVDILGLEPSGPIVAALSGNVRYIGKNQRLGNYVELDHGEGLVTVYGNCQEIVVLEGEKVREGQEIARLKGDAQPYVHFELRQNGKPLDPLSRMPDASGTEPQQP